MELSILSQVIIGMIQGITEWLPVSSTAFVSLYLTNFLGITNLESLVEIALFFHLGTFLSALIYFKREVKDILVDLTKYKKLEKEKKSTINFLVVATIISGIIGIGLLFLFSNVLDSLEVTGKGITLVIGVLLLITGLIQLNVKKRGIRKTPNFVDSIVLGVGQGISALPGISRSGITVSALLLRKIDETRALKLSFLLSLPIVFFGNIILNFTDFKGGQIPIFGILSAFVFGFLTIHYLLKLSRKINFGWFCSVFGILMGVSVLF